MHEISKIISLKSLNYHRFVMLKFRQQLINDTFLN